MGKLLKFAAKSTHTKRIRSSFKRRDGHISTSSNYLVDHTFFLQRTVGNKTVGRIVQARLANGKPGDRYEQEADRVAGKIVRMPSQSFNRTPADLVQRGEKWEQIKRVGPYDAWRAKKDADAALRAARVSGLPGLWNGPADAFRHAYWNCLMVKSIGYSQAKTVADTHEEFGKNHPNERLMDDHNNAIGRLLGSNAKGKDCADLVLQALKNGSLLIIPNYEEVAKSRGKIAPEPPKNSKSISIPKVDVGKARYEKTGYAGSNYN